MLLYEFTEVDLSIILKAYKVTWRERPTLSGILGALRNKIQIKNKK